MKKRDKIILQKIISETDVLEKMTVGRNEQNFLASDELMRATCMTLINIGELVKNLSEECRLSYTQIPWKDMAGLRDVTAHGYFTLRMSDIWIYASSELPEQAKMIRDILSGEPEE
ncbi:MAG: DUF86 domain-containing protein [Oscillospiraceae bacterium]|jgi:uncharacterized protein with HEPN domain|nr:DUF86 domain-containing protein [Oscillospiraceae bacterium]